MLGPHVAFGELSRHGPGHSTRLSQRSDLVSTTGVSGGQMVGGPSTRGAQTAAFLPFSTEGDSWGGEKVRAPRPRRPRVPFGPSFLIDGWGPLRILPMLFQKARIER